MAKKVTRVCTTAPSIIHPSCSHIHMTRNFAQSMTEDEGREQLVQIRQQTSQCAAANAKAEKTLNRLMQHIFIEAEHRMMSRANQSKLLSVHSNCSKPILGTTHAR